MFYLIQTEYPPYAPPQWSCTKKLLVFFACCLCWDYQICVILKFQMEFSRLQRYCLTLAEASHSKISLICMQISNKKNLKKNITCYLPLEGSVHLGNKTVHFLTHLFHRNVKVDSLAKERKEDIAALSYITK